MLELRRGRPDEPDALLLNDEVQRWYVEIYGGPDDDPVDAAAFAAPRGAFLLGYDAGLPVAMGGWSFRTDAPGDAKIRRVFVRPEARGRGVAARLVAELERDAGAAGATRMVLTTGTPQVDAIRLYRGHGYTDIEPFGFYAGSAGAVHLGKALTA